MCSNKTRLALLGAVLCMAFAAFGQTLVVGSYNIRYRNDGDETKGHIWAKRCQVIADQLNYHHPDAFGAQEVLKGQLDDLLRALPDYDYVGVGRDDGHEAGPYFIGATDCFCLAMDIFGCRLHIQNLRWGGMRPAYASAPGLNSGCARVAKCSFSSTSIPTTWALRPAESRQSW